MPIWTNLDSFAINKIKYFIREKTVLKKWILVMVYVTC